MSVSMCNYTHEYVYLYAVVSNGKLKSRRSSFIRLPFALSCKRKFDDGLFVDEETNASYPFAN